MGFDLEALIFMGTLEFWRMALLWSLALISSYFQLLFGRSPSYPRVHPDPSTQPICVITGATSGLGAATAKRLSREGYHVVLAGRSLHMLEQIVQEIKQDQKDAYLRAFEIDLSSFDSIVKFKNSLEEWLVNLQHIPSIQLLINNAGALATSPRTTPEGYEWMMGTNYIGAFALTHLLLPMLRKSSIPSRVVFVTSFTHRCVSELQVSEESLSGRKKKFIFGYASYPFAHIYENSKFCLLMFSYELHRRLRLLDPSCDISVMAADPGVVKTQILREVPSVLSELTFKVLTFFGLLQSPQSGSNSVIDAALAPQGISGLYFFGGKGRTIKSHERSYDVRLAQELWTSSLLLLQKGQLTVRDL